MRFAGICLILLLSPAIQAETRTPDLNPYRMVYVAKYNGMPIEAVRELSVTSDGYRIQSRAKNFLGRINETEDFTVNGEGRLLPEHYEYDRSIFGIKRLETLQFDRSEGIAVSQRKGETRKIPLEGNLLGPVSYQEQLRQDMIWQEPNLSYAVIIRGNINQYEFERVGEELLETAAGNIKTVKLRLVREADSPRETWLWMAPDLNYRLVKLLQVEEDGEHYEMLLKEASPVIPVARKGESPAALSSAAADDSVSGQARANQINPGTRDNDVSIDSRLSADSGVDNLADTPATFRSGNSP